MNCKIVNQDSCLVNGNLGVNLNENEVMNGVSNHIEDLLKKADEADVEDADADVFFDAIGKALQAVSDTGGMDSEDTLDYRERIFELLYYAVTIMFPNSWQVDSLYKELLIRYGKGAFYVTLSNNKLTIGDYELNYVGVIEREWRIYDYDMEKCLLEMIASCLNVQNY